MGDLRVDTALERIRGKFTHLQDAMIVQAHLKKRISSRLKEHAELIGDHHEFIKSQQAALRLHTQMGEFDEKLNALIDIVTRMQGGMESRPS